MPKHLRVSEAAKILGVSGKTLRRWSENGKLDPQRSTGNQRFYTYEQLRAFNLLKSQKKSPYYVSLKKPDSIHFSYKRSLSPVVFIFVWSFFCSLFLLTSIFIYLIFKGYSPQNSTEIIAKYTSLKSLLASPEEENQTRVLAATTTTVPTLSNYTFNVNVPSTFSEGVTFKKALSAPNLVNSVQGEIGDVTFSSGTGITISETTISNNDTGSSQKIFKTIKVGSSAFDANGNTDTLEFAGNGATSISIDTANKKLVFSSASPDYTLSGWTKSGTYIYPTTLTNYVGVGTNSPDYIFDVAGDSRFVGNLIVTGGINNQGGGITNAGAITDATGLTSSGQITFSNFSTGILHSNFNGVISSSAVELSGSDVAGVLGVDKGGTGFSSYSIGDILYASSTGNLARLSLGGEGEALTVQDGVLTWSTISGTGDGSCSDCVVLEPGSTQTITPTNTDATGLIIKQANGGTSDIFSIKNYAGTKTYFRIDSSGFLNIGDPSSTYSSALKTTTLSGDRTYTFPDYSGNICLDSGNCAGVGSNLGGSGVTNYLSRWSGAYSLESGTIFDNGSIGIGTANPLAKFQVVGTASISGALTVSSTLNTLNAVNFSSTLGVTGATTLSSTLDITSDITMGGNLKVNGTGNSYFSGKVGIGTTDPSALLTLTGPGSASVLDIVDTTDSDDKISVMTGVGSPQDLVTAQVGSVFMDHSGGVIYVKSSDDGANTGWVSLASTAQLHMAKMTRDAAQTIDNGTYTKVLFDDEVFDIGGIADSTTNDRFDIQRSGKYLIQASWAAPNMDANEDAWISININNNQYKEILASNGPGTNTYLPVSIAFVTELSAGDYLTMHVRHYEGANQNTLTSTLYKPSMSVVELDTSQSGASPFTNADDVTYLTDTQKDFTIGGSSLSSSAFGIDESAATFYFGSDNSANPTFEFEATDNDSGTFGFNTSDAFYFSNANVGIGTTSPNYNLDVSGDINLTGALRINGSAGTSGLVLSSTGTGLSWIEAPNGGGTWTIGNAGVIYPNGQTLDVLVGGTATTSAKFAFKNVLTGTPTASISGTTTNVATFIDGNGNISTTNRANLVLGNSSTYDSTGNVLINPNGTGNVGIGTDSPSGSLHIQNGSSQKVGLILKNATNQSVNMQEWQDSSGNLLTYINSSGEIVINAGQSMQTAAYSNEGGQGDRTSIITVTSSTGLLTGSPSNFVDGVSSSTGDYELYFNNGLSVAGRWVRFDFGSPRLIEESTMTQHDDRYNQGTWKWQASNDASTWTDVSSNFTLGPTSASLSTEGYYYRYYRVLGVSGTTTYNPWIWEMKFKIASQASSQASLVTANKLGISNSNPSGTLEVGDNLLTVFSGGNVAIATSSASYKLDVAGIIRSRSGISTFTKAGTISDSDFTETATNGLLAVDSTDNRLYVRSGDVWKYIAFSGGFQIPDYETTGLSTGDFLIPYVESSMSDGAIHGMYRKFSDVKDTLLADIYNVINTLIDRITTLENTVTNLSEKIATRESHQEKLCIGTGEEEVCLDQKQVKRLLETLPTPTPIPANTPDASQSANLQATPSATIAETSYAN